MLPSERFWNRVDLDDSGCWVWQGSLDKDGYGRFNITRHGRIFAHRFAFEDMVGEIPSGLQIDHLCRNRACCNPYHMEPVTPRVNTLRGNTVQARNARKQACPAGHPLPPYRPGKSRSCGTCSVAKAKERRAAARAGRAA